MDKDHVKSLVASVSRWRHKIDLPFGITTPGFINHEEELSRMGLDKVDLTDKTVLDIGCSDGYYSFFAERRGASHIVGIDDMSSLLAGGNNGFEICKTVLDSSCRLESKSIYDTTTEELGTFDVIFFFNVLYHLKHPILALERINDLLKPSGHLYLKTLYDKDVTFSLGKHKFGLNIGQGPRAKLYPGNGRAGDPTNWWVGNEKWIYAVLKASNFRTLALTHKSPDRIYLKCEKTKTS